MKYISELNVGDRVRFGKIDGNDILWSVGAKSHAGYPSDSVSLITTHALRGMAMDGREPSSANAERKLWGNNYYPHSNLHQWLNKQTQPWFVAAHATDAAPNSNNVSGGAYEHEYGFLNNLPEALREKILDTSITVAKPTPDGGGAENITAKVFLLSRAEVDGSSEGGTREGNQWALFQNQNSRIATDKGGAARKWWLRSPNTEAFDIPGDHWTGSGTGPDTMNHYYRWDMENCNKNTASYTLGGVVGTDGTTKNIDHTIRQQQGANIQQTYYYYTLHNLCSTADNYLRPALNLPSDVRITDEPDNTGAYEIVYNTPPVISGSDQDLGSRSDPLEYKYTVSDEDTTKTITVTEVLTGGGQTRTLRSYTVQNGAENTAAVSDQWLYVQSGLNTLTITADDGNGGVATRTVTFTRTIGSIAASRAISTDAVVKRAMFSLFPQSQNTASDLVVQATNNPFDLNPVWEDVTQKVGKYVHVFENATAQNGPGLAYRFRITPGTSGKVAFDSMHVRFEQEGN